jgi:ABC-2 type transport system permease protein
MTFGMVVMIPFIQLLLFAYAINTNIRDIPTGIIDHSQTSLSRVLKQTGTATGIVKFTHQYTSVNTAQAALDKGEVRAILIIPNDVSQRLVRHPTVGLGLPPLSDQ